MSSSYTAKDIETLEGLEAIRERPGMYVGAMDAAILAHLVEEALDNSIDECLTQYATQITVIYHRDGAVEVIDDGRGIPVEYKAEQGKSALELVFTERHAGGKFSQSAYSRSGGMHGIGLKAIVALSDYVEVAVYRHGVTFRQKFLDGGSPESPVRIVDATGRTVGQVDAQTKMQLNKKEILTGLQVKGKRVKVQADPRLKAGTSVRFRPWRDCTARTTGQPVFDLALLEEWPDPVAVPWPVDRLRERMVQLVHLYPDLVIHIDDQRSVQTARVRESVVRRLKKRETLQGPAGLAGYVAYLNQGQTVVHAPFYLEGETEVELGDKKHALKVQVAMQYTRTTRTELYGFANGIANPDGGSHVSGFQAGLTKAIKGIGEGMRGIKTGSITGNDITMGLTAVAAIEMPWTPSFEGQTKRRLLSREVQGPVMSIVYQELQKLLAKRKNAKTARNILELIIAAQQERATTEQLRKVTKNDKGTSLLGKLTPVAGGKRSRPVKERRLWLVEGDSAGGTAKEARDPKRDAILPLRGKVLNVAGKRLSQALKNQEIAAMVQAIGAGAGPKMELDQANYGQVIMLCDADPDGGHIQALLMTVAYELFRPLIKAGMFYAARPPLYKVEAGGKRWWAYSEAARDDYLAQAKGQATARRYKGLGEMSAAELEETVFENEAGIVQVVIDDDHLAREVVDNLMGRGDATFRRQWLYTTIARNINIATELG